MAVPRHHMAKGKQLRRRSHLALKPKRLLKCTHCGKAAIPHSICKFCGYYEGRSKDGRASGRQIIDILAKELKKQEKQRQRTASK